MHAQPRIDASLGPRGRAWLPASSGRATAALSHPHILPLFDSGEADGFLCYVMPCIQGETIRGIAPAVSAAAGGRMTETGLSLGTPHCMSPEQAADDG